MGEGGAYGNGVVKELITRGQADALFTAVLLLGVLLGPLAWFLAKRRGGNPLAAALAAGGGPILVGVLWRVYNAIADSLGLDTVRNLVANLVLFVVLGAVIGAVWARFIVRDADVEDAEPPAAGEAAAPGEV